MPQPPTRIALTGYSRTGKDEIGKILSEHGFKRFCLGDVIKSKFDALCREIYGFSAFTEIDEEKAQIRKILEQLGYADSIFNECFAQIPKKCVNTRIFRLKEAIEWKKAGGVLWEVRRTGGYPLTFDEETELQRMKDCKLIDEVVFNFGSLSALKKDVLNKICVIN